MVNIVQSLGIDPASGHPERALAFSYAPQGARAGVLALFALDATLGKLARHTREPVAAQLRLAWWRDALGGLAAGPIGGQPLLGTLRDTVLPAGVGGAGLARMVDGWEALVVGDIPAFGADRGRGLFEAAARVLGAGDPWLGEAGEGWALADLATTSPDNAIASAARERAGPLLADPRPRASRAARPLAALALSASFDLAGRVEGSPARIARLLRLRLTGR
jgi:phytoene synthase